MKTRAKKEMCEGWIASKKQAEAHTKKVFARIDAENMKLDQMKLL